MDSAGIANSLPVVFLLAKVIQVIEVLALEEDMATTWAPDGSLVMDDFARSTAIMASDGAPYVYYSLSSEKEAQQGGCLMLHFGCDSVDIDDQGLIELGNSIKKALKNEQLKVRWDLDPYEGMEISHSKASLSGLCDDAEMKLNLYLPKEATANHPEVFEQYCPNECLEENGDPEDCVNIWLTIAEGETVIATVQRLLPSLDSSDIRYYQRCFDDGEILQPIEQLVEWSDTSQICH